MAELKKHALALSIIALLFLIKFCIVPLLAWQESTIANNQLLQVRLTKSAFALNNSAEMQDNLAKTAERLKQAKDIFFTYQTKSLFQLTEQQKLELIFEQHQIKITKLAWKLVVPLPQWQISQYEIRLDFEGEVVDLQKLQASLDSQKQWYNNHEFNYNFEERRINDLGDVRGRMSLKLYMKAKP